MLSKLRAHVRHNVVGYLALFFALSGVAYAAGPLKQGDPATGDLTGTYPGPTIAAGAVTGGSDGKIADNSVTGDDIASGAVGTSETGTIPAVRVYNTTNQTIPSSTFTFLSFDSEQFDTAGLHDPTNNPTGLVAPVDGIYDVQAWLQWGFSGVDGTNVTAIILASNGSRVGDSEMISPATNTVQNLSGLLQLTAGDSVRIEVRHDNSTAGTIFGTPAAGIPALSMAWIGPKGT